MNTEPIDENQNQQPPITPADPYNQSAVPPVFVPSSPTETSPAKKPSRWHYLFIILGILQAVGVILFLSTMLGVGGKTGSEFIALLLLVTVAPVVALIALLNIITLPIYLYKQKPKGAGLVFSILSLSISAILALIGGYIAVQMYVAFPKAASERAMQSRQDMQKKDQQFAADNAKPEISKDEAITLIQTCKLKGFYYTQEAKQEHSVSPAQSKTGVILTKIDGKPFRISIADRLIPELVPIARAAQNSCGELQFWHDGTYEEIKDGKWYFRGEVVNDMRPPGKTKDEALNLMRDCKVDYFVGYTDMTLIHDSNTKTWLERAEASSTGIETSVEPTSTFIFTSKAATAELQGTARQMRQACYNTKKLYIMIDDWVETEYPIGIWTKVKQRQAQ